MPNRNATAKGIANVTMTIDMAASNIPSFEQAICLACEVKAAPQMRLDAPHTAFVDATAESIRRVLTPNQPLTANNNISPIYALARHVVDVNTNGSDTAEFEARVANAISRRQLHYRNFFKSKASINIQTTVPTIDTPEAVPATKITASARTAADNQHLATILRSLRTLNKINDTLALLLGVPLLVQEDIAAVAAAKADKKKQLELEKIIQKNPALLEHTKLPRNIKNLLAAHRSNAFKTAKVHTAKHHLTQQLHFLRRLAVHTIDNVLNSNGNANNSSNSNSLEIELEKLDEFEKFDAHHGHQVAQTPPPIFSQHHDSLDMRDSNQLFLGQSNEDMNNMRSNEPLLPQTRRNNHIPSSRSQPSLLAAGAKLEPVPISITPSLSFDDARFKAPVAVDGNANATDGNSYNPSELSIVDELQIWTSIQQHEPPPPLPLPSPVSVQAPISLAFEGGDLAKFATASAYNYSSAAAAAAADWTGANYGKTPPAA